MNWYPLGIGALVVAIAVVAYYASKPGNQGSCLPGPPRPCPDAWKDEAGNPVAATMVCDPSTLQPKAPNYGPGKCQVACPAGTVPCWTKAGGVCHTGATCPCQTDKDCPGHGLCNTTTGCSCQPGYLAPECTVAGSCTDDSMCGPHGKCAPDRQSCQCDDGWAPPNGSQGVKPCSACAAGRGPPAGTAKACTMQIYTGINLPLMTTPGNCVDPGSTYQQTMDELCQAEFGSAATNVGWCSNSTNNNACRGAGDPGGCGGNVGALNTNQLYCSVPGGFYAPPGSLYSSYNPCNVDSACHARKPDGYAGIV